MLKFSPPIFGRVKSIFDHSTIDCVRIWQCNSKTGHPQPSNSQNRSRLAIKLFCTMVLLSWTPRGGEAHLSALLSLLSPLSLSLYLSSLLSNSADPTSAASLLAHASPAHPASSAGPLWSSSSPGRRRGPSAELQLARPAALAHGGARPACSPRRRAVRRRVVAPTASTQRGEFNGG